MARSTPAGHASSESNEGAANEQDDDGDELTDYPADPGCDDALDRDERDGDSGASGELLTAAFATLGVGIVLAFVLGGRKPR